MERCFVCLFVDCGFTSINKQNNVPINVFENVTHDIKKTQICVVFSFFSPLPVKPGGGGDFRFPRRLSLCPSVRLSVSQSVSPLGVRPLGFPNFSLSSFEILTRNLVCEFVLT